MKHVQGTDPVGRWAWLATGITVGSYFILMGFVALAPHWLASPLTAGGTFSIGLLGAISVIILCVVTATIYTVYRNAAGDGG